MKVLWFVFLRHIHGGQWYFHDQLDHFRLAECIDVIIMVFPLNEVVQFSLINLIQVPFFSEHFRLIWKNDSQQKTIFLDTAAFSLVPNTFNFWRRVMTTAQKCALLDYCYIFQFLCNETCLSSQMHAPVLLHSHWNIVYFQL